ncbi:maltose/maltodextrin ABC transporter, permease protein malF [Vibrio ishigakensis]|uniref:Maltose/maltodextrin ABC transporter, permease protein malF n=1 Tax=Vibrio ishigakensis TaxID=1481914 RepID=A0A0B8NWK0_9VIBR|nr:maltose/maltodextrin ABC transporter, permease protein malF [Vibrio ishigakensis]
MGSAQIKRGDQIKGVFLLVIQLLFIFYIPQFIHSINGLITLGEVTQQRNGFEVIQGDNSIHLLVEGVVMASFLVMFITLYVFNVKDP